MIPYTKIVHPYSIRHLQRGERVKLITTSGVDIRGVVYRATAEGIHLEGGAIYPMTEVKEVLV